MTSGAASKVGVGVRPGSRDEGSELAGTIFGGMFGALLGLTLLKFSNPVMAILEEEVAWPGEILEWLLNSWPVVIGYWLLAVAAVAGVVAARWKRGPGWLIAALPIAWLIWEFVAALHTRDSRLTKAVLVHFSSAVVCFYLGLYPLSRVRDLRPFWAGIMLGWLVVLLSGLQQHFGGLEETRRYYWAQIYPKLTEPPSPAFLLKMQSNRIFSTLFYPNTLAGVILILLPVTLGLIWSLRDEMTAGARALLMSLMSGAALSCLYWSGSKGGWLLMLVLVLVWTMFLPLGRRMKWTIVGGVLVVGLAGFGWKYSGYFNRGATSVGARFDYWRGVLNTVRAHPLLGTGPGTFGETYAEYHRTRSLEGEFPRLAHNDYLQQASDSGVPGFVFYGVFVITTLAYTGRKLELRKDWLRLAVWLGVLGWALQSLMEFGLYIPAIAWPAFTFMGWLLGQASNPPIANPSTGASRPGKLAQP